MWCGFGNTLEKNFFPIHCRRKNIYNIWFTTALYEIPLSSVGIISPAWSFMISPGWWQNLCHDFGQWFDHGLPTPPPIPLQFIFHRGLFSKSNSDRPPTPMATTLQKSLEWNPNFSLFAVPPFHHFGLDTTPTSSNSCSFTTLVEVLSQSPSSQSLNSCHILLLCRTHHSQESVCTLFYFTCILSLLLITFLGP